LKLAKENRPDLITLDIIMPEKDGWSVLKTLKSDPELSEIPVVLVTIMGDEELGYALGAADFVNKPFDKNTLVGVLKRHWPGTDKAEVLVVDDEAETRELLRRTLEKEGWTVAEAVNGRDALEKLQNFRPQLILLDLMMPEVDGFEVMEKLRRDETLQDIPVIVVTAKDLTGEEADQLRGHVDNILRKGDYKRAELLEVVRERLAQRGDAN
jgi:CheY-like chemotaxis protein